MKRRMTGVVVTDDGHDTARPVTVYTDGRRVVGGPGERPTRNNPDPPRRVQPTADPKPAVGSVRRRRTAKQATQVKAWRKLAAEQAARKRAHDG